MKLHPSGDKLNNRKRMLSLLMAFLLLLASLAPAGYSILADENSSAVSEAASVQESTESKDCVETAADGDAALSEMEHITLELLPEEKEQDTLKSREVPEETEVTEENETSILLDGMMPKNATAKAVDVTDERTRIEAAEAAEVAAKEAEAAEKEAEASTNETGVSANETEQVETEIVTETEIVEMPVVEEVTESIYSAAEDDYPDATQGDADATPGDAEEEIPTEVRTEVITKTVTVEKKSDEVSGDKVSDDNESDDEVIIPSRDLVLLAAYDITILDGKDEFQPLEKHPITVSIRDPRIKKDAKLYLWHIKDDGEKEEIKEFTVTDGELTFDAKGFSVYEIVSGPEEYDLTTRYIESKDDFISDSKEVGFFLFYSNSSGNNIFFTNSLNGNSAFVETNSIMNASVWYFEKDGDNYYLYTYVDDEKLYLTNPSGNLAGLGDNDSKTAFSLEDNDKAGHKYYYFKIAGADKWLQHSGGGSGIRFYTDKKNATNSSISAIYASSVIMPKDPYDLDGTTHGLINASVSGTTGYALMAKAKSATVLEACEMKIKPDTVNKGNVFVTENAEITEWTFHSTTKDNYTLSTVVDGKTMYLQMTSSGLTIAESDPTEFKVVVKDGKIKLYSGGKAVSCNSANGFKCENDGTAARFWLSFSVPSILTEDDFVNYSANKIGVSDVADGQQVIVYTRVWDDANKTYEFYAIDHDGTLYPCYERGDNIMWIGSQFNTLLWDFTEYHYDDGTPNYYYELQNVYSEMFLAPQIGGNQTIASKKIGINLPKRKEGEYYSEILAWDDPYYSYAGLKVDENLNLVSCPKPEAIDFYFAVMDTVVPTLNEVNTIDNNQYGIQMKMVDFTNRAQQNAVLGDYSDFNDHKNAPRSGILTTDIKSNDYPNTLNGSSLKDLYSDAKTVNHLFIESTYNASGYFEYDSCQNFASLKGKNEGDFTVYKEIGTMNTRGNVTDKHGQFMPYNDIYPGVYSTKNPQNLYDVFGNLLPESDPRKYETLYRVGNANDMDATNWNFGMELEASFVQTPSGKDAWGHDIIFEFTGDDDFWLYVDDELVLDLGGIHSALPGKVNFATGKVEIKANGNVIEKTLRQVFTENYMARNPDATSGELNTFLAKYFDGDEVIFSDYSSHTMKIFYMERGEGASNLHMRFNLSYVTPGHVIFSKEVTGTTDMDFDLVQYPYQIWYKDEEHGNEHLLGNAPGLINVTYQNSTQTVDYAATYTPPGSTNTYDCVYFLYPGKAAEIHFPADTIEYRIIECGINNEVYDHVYVNDVEIEDENITSLGDSKRSSYDSGWLQVSQRPKVTFNNHVDSDGLRTLTFQKKVKDENGDSLTYDQDQTLFDFRLYLSNGIEDDLYPANMAKYCVTDPEGYLCEWNAAEEKFVSSTYRDYSDFNIEPGDSEDTIASKNALKAKFTFNTSMNGAISKIPAWYSVEVPNLPVGVRFKVEERFSEIPVGYGRVEYERGAGGSYITEDGDTQNTGRIRANESPQMNVINKRGFGLEADKVWSDKSYTKYHDNVYTALYVDGIGVLEDTVRELVHPNTYVRYFQESLKPGKTLADYSICELELVGDNITVNEDGEVSGFTSYRVLNEGDEITLAATSKSTNVTDEYNYAVTYEKGEPRKSIPTLNRDNIRIDRINNTRTGGVVMSLFDMSDRTTPLAGGVFTLQKYDSVNDEYIDLGTFTSDSAGRINILYDFDRDTDYILTETAAPKGYIGAANPVTFRLNDSDEITITSLNEAEWQDGDKLSNNNEKLIAYVNIYNKPYTLKVYKSDRDNGDSIPETHFAIYKGKTGGHGGVIKDYYPMTGYEDLITDVNGQITAIDNNLPAGIYFIEETQPPTGYEGITGYIQFEISSLGGISIISSPVNSGVVLETGEDNTGVYIYTLKIPNKKDVSKELTITKTVVGNQGNKAKDFTFTFEVTGDDGTGSEEYAWKKNDVEQTTALKSHGTFTLSHGESVVISVPSGAEVTITEASEDYKPSFKLGDAAAEDVSTKTFTVNDDTTLAVTNTRNGIIPTGVWMSFKSLGALGAAFLAGMFYFWRRKKKTEEFLDRIRNGE